MKAMRTVQINAQWLDKGYFVLWSEPYARPPEIIRRLFAYHAPSYYGTFIRTDRQGIHDRIVLPAEWSVDYWLQPPVNEHATISWSEEAAYYMRVARIVQQAMREQWVLPDYARWRKGGYGWRIEWNQWLKSDHALHQDMNLSLDDRLFADKWLSQVIQSYLSNTDVELEERIEKLPAYERYMETYRKQLEMVPAEWMDEDDWLVSLGWEEDLAPFHLALQLSEPDETGQWRLTMRVQDRSDSMRSITCTVKGEVLQGDCPDEWKPYLTDRIYRESRKILTITGQLTNPEHPGVMTDRLNDEQAWLFLMEWSPRLIEYGVIVLLPSWWDRVQRARPTLRTRILSPISHTGEGILGLKQLLQFDWQVSIGDLNLTREEYMQLAASQKKLASIRGRWVVVDQALLQNIQKKLKKYEREGGMPLQDVLEYGLLKNDYDQHTLDETYGIRDRMPMLVDLEFGKDMEEFLNLLQRIHQPPQISIPRQLRGSLRHYQLEGVSWLTLLRHAGLGGCLADDMGLGKTVQWIAYLLHVKETEHPRQPSLLICPTSVLGNWQKEFERFAPSLSVHLHHGSSRLKGEGFRQAAADSDVVLTSYSLAALDQDELKQVFWDAICLDEAQNIKNAHTKQAQAIQHLTAKHRVAMTGTPIENRLSELWSIMNFANPGYLGSLRQFDRYTRSIEREHDEGRISRVQALVRPFLLRREKNDPAISVDLPAKEELKCYVSLTAEQSVLYEQQLEGLFRRIDSLFTMERRGAVLSTIMRLKQLCDHPAMLQRDYQLPADQLLEQSNKLMRLVEMVEEVREAGERCIIFTQFIEMGKLLQTVLKHRLREKVMFMHGGISKSVRDEMIAEFQQEDQAEPCGAFILSLKTGGTGLNLTAANHVFHYDRWWNPAVENQASDRVYRIGQQKNVFVHKFISIGTLEEKIDAMLEHKMGLSRKIVGSGEQWIGELSNDELRELLELR